ncbi:MAG: hypothetical protein B6D41_00875 [Chloroflexi bacterium UTCFX4]|nr:MAG: hypothetical protein B6D41_00875 [Chloroflexi bacterium UTCFX4]
MISRIVIVGSVLKAPKSVNADTIHFQVVARTGDHAPRPIIFHISASGSLAREFFDLKRGDQVLIDASFTTTSQGNPPLHYYPDGRAYTQFDVVAESISKIKIPT